MYNLGSIDPICNIYLPEIKKLPNANYVMKIMIWPNPIKGDFFNLQNIEPLITTLAILKKRTLSTGIIEFDIGAITSQ